MHCSHGLGTRATRDIFPAFASPSSPPTGRQPWSPQVAVHLTSYTSCQRPMGHQNISKRDIHHYPSTFNHNIHNNWTISGLLAGNIWKSPELVALDISWRQAADNRVFSLEILFGSVQSFRQNYLGASVFDSPHLRLTQPYNSHDFIRNLYLQGLPALHIPSHLSCRRWNALLALCLKPQAHQLLLQMLDGDSRD